MSITGSRSTFSEEQLAHRRAALPTIRYPATLPISQRKDEILAAVRDNQVVIVAGETGSGKTTQLPKICLELGRGVHGMIGHTQPRRLAARTVADRVAEELGTQRGGVVGYKVRFTEHLGDTTLVKLMTDGILLAEIQHDRQLRQYDTLIIDEAHERSLNIDFILGYVKRLLPRRPELKVIITSATIDPDRFSKHFGDAPVIEVSGRTYPVEVRYRPVADEDTDRDQTQAVCDAVRELTAEGPGDILLFASGEREIRDTADALARQRLPDTEILALYARLSAAEQHRVFQRHPGRRIVVATNIAETSLTVPGIRYVVDPGTARISRYSHRTKVQRLPIEPISQASANQRKGRCGRLSDGICIRLYSEQDFVGRAEFTEPEILRTSLASVILQMATLGLGDVAGFPFIDPPDRRSVKAGVQLLEELGAFDQRSGRRRLTRVGRTLARLPIDPRLARMVLEADRNGCAREVTIIAAALSIQDPRERPIEHQQAATEKHARFAEPESDFLAYLNLWRYLREQQRMLSSNQFRKLCRTEFLNYLRVREWQDLHSQLRRIATGLGMSFTSKPADPDRIHMSVLAGLLSHIGLRDDGRDFEGPRGTRFAIFPGSGLFKKPPRWVMVAELVETSRLWGRIAARVEPEWAEKLAGHLVKRSYSEPHWEKKRAAVMAYEKVTLYGVPIVASRPVNYGGIDPELSRELFIRHALVEGDWDTGHRFFHENRRLLGEVEELEHRARRRDIVVDDDALFAFYDERVGADVVSGRHFDSWWKKVRRTQPDLLDFERSMLVQQDAAEVSAEGYPDAWQQDGVTVPLSYQFEPGDEADGVTARVPLPLLGQLDADDFRWQVPGMREELVTALIRSLPKSLRREFVPAPDHARAVLQRIDPGDGPLLFALERELRRKTGVTVPRDAWDLTRVPAHLTMTFRIEDDDGTTLAEGKDLDALKHQLTARTREAVAGTWRDVEREGVSRWDFGELPRVLEREHAGQPVRAYPTLVDQGSTVSVRMVESEREQARAMRQGTRRLVLLNVPSPLKFVQGQLASQEKLALGHNPNGRVLDLLADCVNAAADALIVAADGPVFDAAGFEHQAREVRAGLPETTLDTVRKVVPVLTAAYRVEHQRAGLTAPAYATAVDDVRAQAAALVFPGFVAATGADRLGDLLRYLRAAERRLEKLPDDVRRDGERMASVAYVRQRHDELLSSLPAELAASEEVQRIRWMIEELRVSYFAQQLGTAYPVSEKRILRAIDGVGQVSSW